MSDIHEMTDHAWAREYAAAYVADGLSVDEAMRLEAHVRDCAPCAAVVEDARRLDRGLNSLFAPVRPGADLEDRAVLKLRAGRPRGLRLQGWPRRALIAATVLLALGGVGALVGSMPRWGGLPMPGEARLVVEQSLLEESKESLTAKSSPKSRGLLDLWDAAGESDKSAKMAIQRGTTISLPDGMDMVSLPVNLSTATTGFVQPGSTVDVLATIRGENGKLRSFPLLVGQKVLALNQHTSLDTGESLAGVSPNTSNVSFAATQQEALLMALAKNRGAHLEVLTRDVGNSNRWFDYDVNKVKDYLEKGEASGKFGYGVTLEDGFTTHGDRAVVMDGSNKALALGRKTNDFTTLQSEFERGDVTNWGFLNSATANPYYQGTNGTYFKPTEHRFALVITPVIPAGTQAKTEPKTEPKKEVESFQPPKTDKPPQQADPETVARRIVIRSGDVEFEVESFDSALATVTKLVTGIKGAYVGTVNSEKLPNGKVKGSITVRTPPESLDGFVLDLRRELGKGGELRGVKIGSQDITKQYFDIESRLKAARTMETRLLQIIKEGKGDIKSLLEAEKELGVWRTKIEEFEGEIRYFSNLASLSTLTITLVEREIRTAAALTESERIQAGVEVEDVDKTYQQLLATVVEMKGRVSKSELKQLALGQFNASLQFEVSPENSGPLRDRLRQLGRVARLEIDRVQTAQGTVTKETKSTRGDTVFVVQLYNVANVAPRETTVLSIAATDVAAAYHALRNAVAKTTGRVHAAQLNEQDRQNLAAQLDFEVRRSEEAAIRAELEAAGEVIARQVTRAPEGENVTDSKVLFRTAIVAANRLKPRELMAVSVQVADVEQAVSAVSFQASESKARQIDSRITREPSGRVTAKLVYEVPLAAAASLAEQFKKTGTVLEQQSVRDPAAPEGKFATARIDVTLKNEDKIVADDAGVWPPVKRGLKYSASVLLTSLTWVVFGLCVVLPWAAIGYGGYRVVRWMGRPAGTTAA